MRLFRGFEVSRDAVGDLRSGRFGSPESHIATGKKLIQDFYTTLSRSVYAL
jgi:hypothetical protein